MGILSLLFGRVIYTDLKYKKIENRVIVVGLVGVYILRFVEAGWTGVWLSMIHMSMVFLVLFPLFVMKGLGAGDIKLFCVVAALFPEYIKTILIVSFLIGAMWVLIKYLLRFLKKEKIYRPGEQICFSIPIGVATACLIGKMILMNV